MSTGKSSRFCLCSSYFGYLFFAFKQNNSNDSTSDCLAPLNVGFILQSETKYDDKKSPTSWPFISTTGHALEQLWQIFFSFVCLCCSCVSKSRTTWWLESLKVGNEIVTHSFQIRDNKRWSRYASLKKKKTTCTL